MTITDILSEALNLKDISALGRSSRGCVSAGRGYQTNIGDIFVKTNTKDGAKEMFDGELASLREIGNTNTILAPKPIAVVNLKEDGWGLVTSFVTLNGHGDSKKFAQQLAEMHQHNSLMKKYFESSEAFVGGQEHSYEVVEKFGFDVPTCCGFLAQNNDWTETWAEFFIRSRLKPQIDRLIEIKGDRYLLEKWPELERKTEKLLAPTKDVIPALVHGDLWSGNYSYTDQNEPVIYDPCSSYADPEFEEGIMNLFGGFGNTFWKAYHSVIPARPGRDERVMLYELYHVLNHWNHFGSCYKSQAINMINDITRAQVNN